MTLPRLPQIPTRTAASPCMEHGCSACCHDNEMLLTESDVARIAVQRPDVDFVFRNDDGFLQLRTRDGPPAKGGSGRPCVFLVADGRCTIHEIRPEGCRTYPGVWREDLQKAELDREYCPHTDGFLLPRATQDAIGRLAQRLLEERDRRSAPR